MAELSFGQVVVSKQGKDVGVVYIVVGKEKDRVLLADAKKYNVGNPKRKNPKHLQPTRCFIDEKEIGERLDNGRFRYLLQKSEQGW